MDKIFQAIQNILDPMESWMMSAHSPKNKKQGTPMSFVTEVFIDSHLQVKIIEVLDGRNFTMSVDNHFDGEFHKLTLRVK